LQCMVKVTSLNVIVVVPQTCCQAWVFRFFCYPQRMEHIFSLKYGIRVEQLQPLLQLYRLVPKPQKIHEQPNRLASVFLDLDAQTHQRFVEFVIRLTSDRN